MAEGTAAYDRQSYKLFWRRKIYLAANTFGFQFVELKTARKSFVVNHAQSWGGHLLLSSVVSRQELEFLFLA